MVHDADFDRPKRTRDSSVYFGAGRRAPSRHRSTDGKKVRSDAPSCEPALAKVAHGLRLGPKREDPSNSILSGAEKSLAKGLPSPTKRVRCLGERCTPSNF